MRLVLAAALCLALAVSVKGGEDKPGVPASSSSPYPTRLSEFGLFKGGAHKPSPVLLRYSLKAPLFSDYAEKQRFILLPPEKKVTINSTDGKLIFPEGTILVKSFGFPDEKGKLRILETRLLLRLSSEWLALPYVWRADGSDADLKLGGARIPVDTKLPDGRRLQFSYAVPNKNQCKTCHSEAGNIVPIGPRIGNIAMQSSYHGQFFAPIEGQFGGLEWGTAPPISLNDRARSYLDINCAHCHNPKGSASNSGLFLGRDVGQSVALGIGKRPVAAGRGSGNFDFVIDPGHPERSILIHRMKSTDPGIAMPELGRATAHDEGIALLEEWIRAMKP